MSEPLIFRSPHYDEIPTYHAPAPPKQHDREARPNADGHHERARHTAYKLYMAEQEEQRRIHQLQKEVLAVRTGRIAHDRALKTAAAAETQRRRESIESLCQDQCKGPVASFVGEPNRPDGLAIADRIRESSKRSQHEIGAEMSMRPLSRVMIECLGGSVARFEERRYFTASTPTRANGEGLIGCECVLKRAIDGGTPAAIVAALEDLESSVRELCAR